MTTSERDISDEGAGIDITALKRMLPELLELAERKDDAAAMLAAGIEAAAYQSRAGKVAIRKLVLALHKDKTRTTLAEASEVADQIEAVAPEAADERQRVQ